MKKITFILLLTLLAVALFFILRSNKNKLDMKQKIAETQVEKIPVRIDTVKSRMVNEINTYAAILNPQKELMVVSQTQGEVEQVNAKVGDYVTRGQVIVRIDDDILQVNLMVAEANFEKAKKDLERFENMIESDGVTRDQLEKMRLNLKNAEANYRTLVKRIDQSTIEAPFSGYVNQMFTREGAMLGPGTPVFEMVDISGFKLNLNVGEAEILGIREGMKTEIRPRALDTVRLEGLVSASAVSTDLSQQYKVEITVENRYPEILKGGMLAEVKLIPEDREAYISIPKEIIRNENGKPFVYTVSEGIARKTWVKTGKKGSDYLQVIEGLDENDLVVVTGMDNLHDGQEVRIIKERIGALR